jgi:hypothetical protein
MYLNLEQLKGKRRYMDVELAELGGTIRLVSFNGTASLKAQEMVAQNRLADREMLPFLMAASIVNEKGEHLFTEETAAAFLDEADTDAAAAISAALIKHLPTLMGKKPKVEGDEGKPSAQPTGG